MKKLILLLLISFSGFSQETQFLFSKDGFTDFVVTNCEGKNKSELFKKVIDWVSITFDTPKEVIKAEIVDDYIRIEGIEKDVNLGVFMGLETITNIKYQIEISVKDEKYKFDVINVESYIQPNQYVIGGWNQMNIADLNSYYKNGKIRNSVKFIPISLPEIFNKLNISLSNFIANNEVSTKKNNW